MCNVHRLKQYCFCFWIPIWSVLSPNNIRTTCRISCTELVQRISKILTPYRLLRNWFAMAHFEAEIPRFLNLYDKVGVYLVRFCWETFFPPKRSLKKGLFGWTPIWGNLFLVGSGGQTGGIWSLGFNGSNWIVEGRWHRNMSLSRCFCLYSKFRGHTG